MGDCIAKDVSLDFSIRFIDLVNSLSALRSLAEVNVNTTDEKLLIRDALKALIHNQEMERCSVFLLEDGYLENATGLDWSDCLKDDPDTTKSLTSTANLSQRFRVGEGVIGKAAATRTLQHCRDCSSDSQFLAKGDKLDYLAQGSLISVPIEVSDNLLGILNISHPQVNFFSEWHERLLLVYCGLMGQLITNNRLTNQLEGEVVKRTKKMEEALSQVHEIKDRYRRQSLHDELTGLFNRRYFFPQAESALAISHRYRHSFSVLIVDIDYFKKVNDTHGHQVGDKVLKKVAEKLSASVRDCDILARFGGEEFAIVLPNTNVSEGERFAERLCKDIREMELNITNDPLSISVSIGVSGLNEGSSRSSKVTIDRLLYLADKALYKAKSSGRNQVIVYQTERSSTF